MDLIYMNGSKADIGVLKDYTFDLAFGSDENNFECAVSTNNHVCEAGFYLYYEGSEYGGLIDSVSVDTDAEEIKYIGRTWHGLLASKVLEPDAGNDYLTVSGEGNAVIGNLIGRMGLGALFAANTRDSGIVISNYKMNRYINGYAGIRKMLKSVGAKLKFTFQNGFVVLSAEQVVDYSQDEQFDTDQISFNVQKNYNPLNHVICLGQGNLKDRTVIHLYANASGTVSETQTFTGMAEVTDVYDNSNAESEEELRKGGTDMLKESWNSDTVEFSFSSNDETYDIGDIVGAKEKTTGIEVCADITKKIVSIKDNTTTISYKVGE